MTKFRVTFSHRAGSIVVHANDPAHAEKKARKTFFAGAMTNVVVVSVEPVGVPPIPGEKGYNPQAMTINAAHKR